MYLCNVWPAQTFFPLTLGTIAETVGLAVLTWAVRARATGLVNGMMVLAGAGTGSRFMPASLHIAGIWPEQIAPAMSLMRFSFPFGGTIGLTIMGSVFNNKLDQARSLLGSGNGDFFLHGSNTQSLSAIADLPAPQQKAVRMMGRDAVMWAFISIMPIIGTGLITGFFLGNVWIKNKTTATTTKQRHGQGQAQQSSSEGLNATSYQENETVRADNSDDEDEDTIQHSEVIYVPYLYAWFKVCAFLGGSGLDCS